MSTSDVWTTRRASLTRSGQASCWWSRIAPIGTWPLPARRRALTLMRLTNRRGYSTLVLSWARLTRSGSVNA